MHRLADRVRAAVDPLDATPGPAPAEHRPAAVLLLLDDREDDLPLLFLQRTDHLRHHPGQIAFPGGVADPTDRSVVDTALREAHEEAAIPPREVEVIGLLPPFVTATSDRWLTPVVALQHGPITLAPNPVEVARLFSIPLLTLAAAPHEVRRLERAGVTRDVHFFTVGDDVVWGATAAIVDELLNRLVVSGSAGGRRTG